MTFCLTEFLKSGAIFSLKKDKLLLGWGNKVKKNAKQLDPTKPAFYMNDFFLCEDYPWIEYSNYLEISYDDFLGKFKGIYHSHSDKYDWKISQFKYFENAFLELQNSIRENVLLKAVPYIFSHSDEKMSARLLVNCLKNATESLKRENKYLYGYWDEEGGVLGLTPEKLFFYSEENPHLVSTMALAGTRQANCSDMEFKMNGKELKEHELVITGIQESVCDLGVVSAGQLQVLQLSLVHHLFTPIEIHLNEKFNFEKILKKLHPTPAVGSFPKKQGEKWLSDFQKHIPRGFYGAPIGMISPENGISSCLVGIRNVQWDAEGMKIGAGAGVISESTLNQEWQEIQLKMQSIQQQFGL